MQGWKRKSILFLTSQGISLFGSSVVQFAIVWYVTLNTSSGIWVTALTVGSFVPQFIISFFAGVLVDRYPRKTIIILSDSVIATATLLLAVLMPYINTNKALLFALIIISIIRSLGTGIQTPAVNAAIPQLVPEDQLIRFNGINSTVQSIVQFAAPAVAGAILSYGTFRSTLFIDIITAVTAISVLSFVTIPFVKSDVNNSMLSDMKSGFTYAVKNQFIGSLLITYGIFIFLCVPAGFLASLYVTRYYGDTYWYMTLVEVIGFIGMASGGLLMGTWGGFKNHITTLTVGIIAFGVLAVGMGIAKSFVLYLVLMAIYGIALTMVQTSSVTLLQKSTSPEMQGKMFGLFSAMYSGFLPIGMVVFGPLSDLVSMRILMILSGVLLIIMSGFILLRVKLYSQKT